MSKKPKKRRRRVLSSSREEDEKKQDLTKYYKSRRNQDLKDQERCEANQEKGAFPSVKNESQSTRQIKKPVYRLAKTKETYQELVKKEEQKTNQKHVPPPDHGGKYSRDARNYISQKDKTVSGSKTEENGQSKHLHTAVAVPQRTEKTSKGSLGEKSSKRSPSKLKQHLMSPSLVPAEQREQRKDELKKKCRAEEPQRTENDSSSVKTKEPSKTHFVSKDSAWEEKSDVFKKMCQKHVENKAKKSMWKEVNTPSASTTAKPSTSAKHTTSTSTRVSSSNVLKKVTSGSEKPSSSQEQVYLAPSFVPFKFKIPKKVKQTTAESSGEKKEAKSTKKDLDHVPGLPDVGASSSNSEEKRIQHAPSRPDVTPSVSSQGQDEGSPLAEQLPLTVTAPWYNQMQLVEELHLARSEKRLEVNVMQSYGDLTCMDIDPPEDGLVDTRCKQAPQPYLILVLDTNILLSHLDYVKKIRSKDLGDLGIPIVLIPWVVLQELDSLKRGRGLSGSVAHLATPAISYIYNSLKSREPFLWGQSMQQAREGNYGLNAENNDDRVLQCCLQYQSLYPECAHILCTNDKNLCSKGLLSGVKALCKTDLEAEFGRSRHGFPPPQNISTAMLPLVGPQVSSAMQSRSYAPVQPRRQKAVPLTVEENDNRREDERTMWDPSSVSELEECLLEVLSDVLEVEMKAAFEDIWLDIVYIKPPWTLLDVLKCFKKHWIAVFGNIVPRRKQHIVSTLINFFNSGDTANCRDASAVLRDAKELVEAFGKRSRCVSGAISRIDNILNQRQPQWESPAFDVVMNEDDEYEDEEEHEQPTPAPLSHQEVWALFNNLWSYVLQMSPEVFKALCFDPITMQSTQPVGGPAPPQDAVDCLHKLSSIVLQLLQIFRSVVSSAPCLEEVQTLLSFIHSNKIVDVDSRLTAKVFLDCLLQQDNREKLNIGGNQLLSVKEVLDRCVGVTCQHITFNTSWA